MSSDMQTDRRNSPTIGPTSGPTSGPIPFTAVLMVTGMIFFAAVATVSAQGVDPAPTITGPIPATTPFGDPSHGFVFSPAAVDLGPRGYVQEEFFIEGTANRYTRSGMETADVVDGGHPYKTRFVVRRPLSPDAFNGTVVVEWNNVTAGQDLDID